MHYGNIAGIEKPVSRLVMGCDNQPNAEQAAGVFDDFFARGATASIPRTSMAAGCKSGCWASG